MSLPDLEAFLRRRLQQPLPGAEAQWPFAPEPARTGWAPNQTPEQARRAAALVLLYPGPTEPLMALTLRHDDLPHHAGQVSLPGGAMDEGEDPARAALRELHEEIGVEPERVRLVGALSSLWVIVSNFLVFPFVGIADTRPDFRPAAREVAELIEVPVSQLVDSTRVTEHQLARDNLIIRYLAMDLAGHSVWGATAMILGEFRELVRESRQPTG